VLAFLFGYSLTVRPVLRAGLSLRQAVKVALAVGDVLLWGSLTLPVNRCLIPAARATRWCTPATTEPARFRGQREG
jgi:hypothetical protein